RRTTAPFLTLRKWIWLRGKVTSSTGLRHALDVASSSCRAGLFDHRHHPARIPPGTIARRYCRAQRMFFRMSPHVQGGCSTAGPNLFNNFSELYGAGTGIAKVFYLSVKKQEFQIIVRAVTRIFTRDLDLFGGLVPLSTDFLFESGIKVNS